MGADCIANNLHFHIVYANHMFAVDQAKTGDAEGAGEMFPIELVNKKLFFRTTLQHLDKNEINMYNCAVRFGELGDVWPLKTLILSPDIDEQKEDVSLEDA